jgi:hypothetical protein
LFDFLGAFEILVFLTAIEHALDAFGFAAAEVRFADVRPHHFTACGEFEPLGGGFVSFDFRHAIYSLSISDFRFWILDSRVNHGAGFLLCHPSSKIGNK